VEHDPRIRGDKPFPKTGIHPRLRKGMLFGIMLQEARSGEIQRRLKFNRLFVWGQPTQFGQPTARVAHQYDTCANRLVAPVSAVS